MDIVCLWRHVLFACNLFIGVRSKPSVRSRSVSYLEFSAAIGAVVVEVQIYGEGPTRIWKRVVFCRNIEPPVPHQSYKY